jgi:predicted nucleic acid-binding protein
MEGAQILLDYAMFTLPIKPLEKISVIDADADDDKFIECAVAAKAGYIVFGDKHLLDLKNYRGIQIMKAAHFLDIFE